MSTQILFLEGKAKWAKVHPGQEDIKFVDKEGKGKRSKIDLYPTAEAMIIFKTSGGRKEVKQAEDGEFIQFSRTIDQELGKDGHILGFPEVVITKGDHIEPFTENIGNGSDVVLKVAIYDSKFGKGTRLEGVNVIKLVPYEGGPKVVNADNPYAF
jgi:hypothetical protein